MQQTKSRVLVVDDVRQNLLAIEALLANLDCATELVSSGEEALRIASTTNEFALAILDVQMPGMTGYEVAARLRRIDSALPIIFVTATIATEETALRGYESGAVDVLFKPLHPDILRSKVKVFLELHRTREALANEAEAHRQTLAELDAFSYSVSHDLRAPLRAVEGFTKVIAEDYGHVLDDTAQRHLHRIAHGAERMKSIIDDLLRLAQISRKHPTCETVDVTQLAEDIVADIRASERRKDVEVRIHVGMRADADAPLVRIALENLVRNAWKFTRDEEYPEIEIGARHDAFFVADNGVGFDPTQGDRLFQPFIRLHGSDFDGTGIGLSIVQRIVTHHGGSIRAEGVPGRGATFSFTLDAEALSLDRPGVASVRRTSQVVQVGSREDISARRARRS